MITVCTLDLSNAMKYVEKYVIKDDNRPILKGIHMKQIENSLVIEAVDGYRVARQSIHIVSHDDTPFEVVVPPFCVGWGGVGFVNLENNGTFMIVTNFNIGESHSHRIIQGEYMCVDAAIPKDDPSFTIKIMGKVRAMTSVTIDLEIEMRSSFAADLSIDSLTYTKLGGAAVDLPDDLVQEFTYSEDGDFGEFSSYEMLITVQDNAGLVIGASAVVGEIVISSYTPMMSIRKMGVGVNCINDGAGDYIMKVRGKINSVSDEDGYSGIYENGVKITGGSGGGSSSPLKNWLINGGFDIWQRGNSLALADVTKKYLADRWFDYVDKNGGTLPTLTRSKADDLTAGYESISRLSTNGAGASLGTASYHKYSQRIWRGTRKLCGASSQLSISFWARSSISGKKVGLYFVQNYGTGGSPTADESIVGDCFELSSTWTKYTLTISTNTLSGKTFGSNNDDYLEVAFMLMWGTDKAALVGESAAETYVEAGTIDLAKICFEQSDSAGEYLPEEYSDVLRQCQAYYYKITSEENPYTFFGMGKAYNSEAVNTIVNPKVTMIKKPSTIDISSMSHFMLETGASGITSLASMDLNVANSKHSFFFNVRRSYGFSTGNFYVLVANNTLSAYLGFDAEI